MAGGAEAARSDRDGGGAFASGTRPPETVAEAGAPSGTDAAISSCALFWGISCADWAGSSAAGDTLGTASDAARCAGEAGPAVAVALGEHGWRMEGMRWCLRGDARPAREAAAAAVLGDGGKSGGEVGGSGEGGEEAVEELARQGRRGEVSTTAAAVAVASPPWPSLPLL